MKKFKRIVANTDDFTVVLYVKQRLLNPQKKVIEDKRISIDVESIEKEPDEDKPLKIRCPSCKWKYKGGEKWFCLEECGAIFDTFATAGFCVRCCKAWNITVCLQCKKLQPHISYYEVES